MTAPADCPFCARIAAGEFDYEGLGAVAFQPLDPITPGHFLVVPRRHLADALEVPRTTGYAAQFAASLAKEMGLDAFNLITSAGEAATQTVRHLHWHVVPRSDGDGLALPWTAQKAASAERELLTDAADALWKCAKAALTVKPNLDKPYDDAPEWSPWTLWVEPRSRRAHDLARKIRRHLREATSA